MKLFKRILCLVLSLLFIVQMMTGCSSKKTDDEIYLTKGEFFAYFVYLKSMSSDNYTSDEIEACKDGSVEADIIVEWNYLTEEQAKKGLNKPVNKETVVMVCANATFELKEGKISDIKDADLLDNPQLIANAYESNFFELDNGYFDGAQKMTLADCEAIIEKANEYTSNFHYEKNTETYSYADDVIVDEGANYSNGDIVVEFFGESNTTASSFVTDEVVGTNSLCSSPTVTLLGATDGDIPVVRTLDKTDDEEIILLDNKLDIYGFDKIKGFTANIFKNRFENELHSPQPGDTIVLNTFEVLGETTKLYKGVEIIGILRSAKLIGGTTYQCIFDYPNFEEAGSKIDDMKKNASGTGVSENGFEKLVDEYEGWGLSFKYDDNIIKVEAKKDFTVYETGRKKDWQNAKKTITATSTFTISDFNVDVNNIKSFATKKGTGFVKITCDTDMNFDLETSLRYTPDSNRNGKFPSNWKNSRWTNSDAQGATEIKIARFRPVQNGIIDIEVYIYLKISVDGKMHFGISIADGGVQLNTNNGKISKDELGTKTEEMSAQINLQGRAATQASIKLFTFIDIFTYDVGFDLDAYAMVNLYYEDKLSKEGVCADEEGLTEYANDDEKFTYCIGVSGQFSVSGKLEDCAAEVILDALDKGTVLNFDKPIITLGIHFEDGHKVNACTRGNDPLVNIEKLDEDNIELSTYKVSMDNFTCTTVELDALPAKTVEMIKSKNSVTVESKNEKIVKAKYDKTNKTIILEAVGEGSTEIVIKAKKGILWWKETVEQEISVTVNAVSNVEGMSYTFTYPIIEGKLYYV